MIRKDRATVASVGIPTYNGAERLDYLLRSIMRFDEGIFFRLVVLDDGSPSDGARRIKGVCQKYGIRLIEHEDNRGIAKSWNDLTNYYEADVQVLLNDDVLVVKDWLKALVYFLENNECGSASLPFYFCEPQDVPRILTGEDVTPRDPLTKQPAPHKKNEVRETMTPGVLMCPSGNVFAFKREMYDLVGGFDERFKSFFEESITGDRFIPILHSEGGSSGQVEIVRISDFFNRFKDSIVKKGDKDYIYFGKWEWLTLTGTPIYHPWHIISWYFSPMERKIYLKKFLEGKGTKEIAKELNFSEGLVQNYITRARKKLRKRLAVNEGRWEQIKYIMRHKTNKKVFRVEQKYGQTKVTENHSLIVNPSDKDEQYSSLGFLSYFFDVPEAIRRFQVATPLEVSSSKNLLLQQINFFNKPSPLCSEVDLKEFLPEKEFKVIGEDKRKQLIFYETNAYRKKIPKVRRFIQGSRLENFLKLLAMYISEGSITYANYAKHLTIVCSNDEKWVKQAKTYYDTIFDANSYVVISRKKNYANLYALRSNNKLSATIFERLGGKDSKGKKMPSFVYHLSEENQKIFLMELLRGDGHIDKRGHFMYETTSVEIASDLSFLLTLLGHRFTVRYREETGSFSIRTNTKYHTSTKLSTKITQEPYDGYVYDLGVEENHTFVDACGMILLHNSDFGTKLAQKGFKSYGLTYPMLWHVWSQTFRENPELEARKTMQMSHQAYIEKWGVPKEYWDMPFDYTNPKYMSKIPRQKVKWLGANGKVYEGWDS